MNGYYWQVIKIIREHGGFFVRNGRGDHEIWSCNGKKEVVDRSIKSRILANKILKALLISEKI